MWRFRVTIAIMALVAAGCRPTTQYPTATPAQIAAEAETQRELALQRLYPQQARLFVIGYRLRAANAPLCPSTGYGVGLALRGDGRTVLAVAPGAVADKAGFKVGDQIVAVNGAPPPERADAAAEKFAALVKTGAPLDIGLRRNGVLGAARLSPEPVCNYEIALEQARQVNARANGREIRVTTAMMRFAKSDVELAAVVGHELAHNAMGHVQAQMGNAMIGVLFDILAAAQGGNTKGQFASMTGRMFSQGFEAEADYVGLYYARRAGFAIEGAPNLWRRMAVAYPDAGKGGLLATHPATTERFLALEQTVTEIKDKEARGAPLVPEPRR